MLIFQERRINKMGPKVEPCGFFCSGSHISLDVKMSLSDPSSLPFTLLPWTTKLKIRFQLSFLISAKNPQSLRFFENLTTIRRRKRRQIESKANVIHPFSMFRLYYELWMGVVFLSCLTLAPVEAAFRRRVFIHYCGLFLDVACLLDIILRFRTAYVDRKEREIELSPGKIAKKYLISVYFVTDLLSSLPDPSLFTEEQNIFIAFISFLGLLKLLRIMTTHQYILRSAQNFDLDSPLFRIGITAVFFILICHWTCCLIFILPQVRFLLTHKYYPKSWFIKYSGPEKTIAERYTYGMFRAIAYIFCIRGVKTESLAWEEKNFAWWSYIGGKILMGYLTVVVVAKFLDFWSLESKYFEKVNELECFMTRQHLKPATRSRLVQYYNYRFQGTYFQESKIKEFLPERLRKEVNSHVFKVFSESVEIFSILRQETVNKIFWYLHAEVFLPQDTIIQAGTPGNCMYFLSSGTVAVYTPSGKEVCHLQDGAYFGEICLLMKDVKRKAHVIAVEFSTVYKLSKKGFNSCLRSEKEVIRRMLMKAEERMKVTQVYEDVYLGGGSEEILKLVN